MNPRRILALIPFALASCGSNGGNGAPADAGPVSPPAPISVTAGALVHSGTFIEAPLVTGIPGSLVIELSTKTIVVGKNDAGPQFQATAVTQSTGTFDLAAEADVPTCHHCVYVRAEDGRTFGASSGKLTLTAVDVGDPSVSSGTLSDVVFTELTIDPVSFQASPTPGGETLELTSLSWDLRSPEGRTCLESLDCDLGWVCDPASATCDRTDDCTTAGCASGQVCMAELGPGGPRACYPACTPFAASTGCAQGMDCVPSGAAGEGVCLASGTATPGEACAAGDVSTGCAAGARCVDEDSLRVAPLGRCAATCDFFSHRDESTCAPSETCTPEGVCAPASGIDPAIPGDPCEDQLARYCGGAGVAGLCEHIDENQLASCLPWCLQSPAADGSPTGGMAGADCASPGLCVPAGFAHAPAAGVAGICTSGAPTSLRAPIALVGQPASARVAAISSYALPRAGTYYLYTTDGYVDYLGKPSREGISYYARVTFDANGVMTDFDGLGHPKAYYPPDAFVGADLMDGFYVYYEHAGMDTEPSPSWDIGLVPTVPYSPVSYVLRLVGDDHLIDLVSGSGYGVCCRDTRLNFWGGSWAGWLVPHYPPSAQVGVDYTTVGFPAAPSGDNETFGLMPY